MLSKHFIAVLKILVDKVHTENSVMALIDPL